MRDLFVLAVERIKAYISYNKQKEGKLQELIRSLKRQSSFMLKNEAKKTEEMIKQSKPIMTKKVEILVMKQLSMLMESTSSSY
jgi:hypothetical protein